MHLMDALRTRESTTTEWHSVERQQLPLSIHTVWNYPIPHVLPDGTAGYELYVRVSGFCRNPVFEVQYQGLDGHWEPLEVLSVQKPFGDDLDGTRDMVYPIWTDGGTGTESAPFRIRVCDPVTDAPTNWLPLIPPLPSQGWVLPDDIACAVTEEGTVSFTWTSNPQLDLYNRMLCFSPVGSDSRTPYCAGRSRQGHCNGEPLASGSYHFSVAVWAGERHLEADIPVDVCVRLRG